MEKKTPKSILSIEWEIIGPLKDQSYSNHKSFSKT